MRLLILLFIIAVGLFFRAYHPIYRFEFAHDGDLYSWIAKDILVNHHLRLIGQLTSAPGIFIGPLFYYLLVPFFILSNMDPIGAILPITILGILTIFSYYFVFKKLYNEKIALIASFIYACSLNIVKLDRWVVPSTLTNIWAIWYFYTVVNILRGNFKVLPLLGLLIGLIWHIHIALTPTLIAVPIAFFFAKKIPNLRQIVIFLLITFISSLPLIIFEGRHSFVQTKSLVKNFTANFGTSNNISETRKIFLGSKNDNAALNLNQSSQFTLEVEPQTPKVGDRIDIKVTGKNPKYSTTIINLNCGDPQKFEIGAISADFKWSTIGCKEREQNIAITSRTLISSFWEKLITKASLVFSKVNVNINSIFIYQLSLGNFSIIFTLIILTLNVSLWRIKALSLGEVAIFYSWILGVFLFFSLSSIEISEYYLASLDVIFILSLSALLYKLYRQRSFQYIVLGVLALFLLKNLYFFINMSDYKKGYTERKAVVNYIATNARANNYPCIGISYITSPGENVGFRYFIWLNKLHLTHPSLDVPVYNIVLPDELSNVDKKFGHIGVSLPKRVASSSSLAKICQAEDTNLSDPLFGYTQ